MRAAIGAVAPRLSAAKIQHFGKLLGIFIGPTAEMRQWANLQVELRARSRYLASLNLAWSGSLPLYRSHVFPVLGHVAAMAPIPEEMFATEAACLAIILKTPAHAAATSVVFNMKAYGFGMDVPDLATLGLASTFRAALASNVLLDFVNEHGRTRRARAVNLSPFLREWTMKGVVGHMHDTMVDVQNRIMAVPPQGRGVQAWAGREFRKQWTHDIADQAIAQWLSTLTGNATTQEQAARIRFHMHAMRPSVPPVVLASVLRSVCNAWTTSGRFSGPTLHCPFGCGLPEGDRWIHFPCGPSIKSMWEAACPGSHPIVRNMTLEHALLLTPDLPSDAIVQLALWTDVVGHLSNDSRLTGISPTRVLREGVGMIGARLRQLAVQSDQARGVIGSIRVLRAVLE